jgi:hypothetical protein
MRERTLTLWLQTTPACSAVISYVHPQDRSEGVVPSSFSLFKNTSVDRIIISFKILLEVRLYLLPNLSVNDILVLLESATRSKSSRSLSEFPQTARRLNLPHTGILDGDRTVH